MTFFTNCRIMRIRCISEHRGKKKGYIQEIWPTFVLAETILNKDYFCNIQYKNRKIEYEDENEIS